MVNEKSNKKVLCLIQARMGSSRLPGKVMKEINGKSMISIIVNSLKKSQYITKIIVATSDNLSDDIFVEHLKKNKIDYFRGSEQDALSRFYFAAKKENPELVVRITGDCPLIEPKIVDQVIEHAIKEKSDYCSNVEQRTFPRGYDTEVFTFNALEKMFYEAKDPSEREHVTLFINNNPELFNIQGMVAPSDKQHPEWRICVDTMEDFDLIKKIFEHYPTRDVIEYDDIINLFTKYPQLSKINENVKQKLLML